MSAPTPIHQPTGEWRGGAAAYAAAVERLVQQAVEQGHGRTVTNPETIDRIVAVYEQAARSERGAA